MGVPQESGDGRNGIEITPEMIAAGRNRLWEWDRDTETASDTALRVYRAMDAVRSADAAGGVSPRQDRPSATR